MNTDGFINSLKDWQERIGAFQDAHYSASSKLDRRHYQIGVFATILSVLAGSTIFVRLGSNPDIRIQIAVGTISVLSAVITGIMTFYNHAKRAEQTRSASATLGGIRREIDIRAQFPPKTEKEMISILEGLSERITKISSDAPAIEAFVEKVVDGVKRSHAVRYSTPR